MTTPRSRSLSLESIFLLLFVFGNVLDVRGWLEGINLFLFYIFPLVLVGAYVLLDLFVHHPLCSIARWMIVSMLLFMVIGVQFIGDIASRRATGIINLHDGAVQTEAALAFLHEGKNPYTESFKGTELSQWNEGYVGFFLEPEPVPNPAMDHFVYPPGYLAISYPFFFVATNLVGWFDQRIVFSFFLLIFIACVVKLVAPNLRALALILLLLNPLFFETFLFGFNDIVVLALLGCALLLLRTQRFHFASALLAVAVGTKHALIFGVVPLLGYMIIRAIQAAPNAHRRRQRVVLVLLPFILTMVVLFLPPWIMSGSAFIDDLVRYPAGQLATSYPITGLGFSQILRIMGLVEWREYFPFWIAQLFVLLPTGYLFGKNLWRAPRLSFAVVYAGIWFGLAAFFSRFLNLNYLSVSVTILFLGYFLQRSELEKEGDQEEAV